MGCFEASSGSSIYGYGDGGYGDVPPRSRVATINAPLAPPPQQFTSAQGTEELAYGDGGYGDVLIVNPTIFGSIDGTNGIFYIGVGCRRAKVFRNGVAQTLNYDCVFGGVSLLFLPRSIPQPGDIITIYGWPY